MFVRGRGFEGKEEDISPGTCGGLGRPSQSSPASGRDERRNTISLKISILSTSSEIVIATIR